MKLKEKVVRQLKEIVELAKKNKMKLFYTRHTNREIMKDFNAYQDIIEAINNLLERRNNGLVN